MRFLPCLLFIAIAVSANAFADSTEASPLRPITSRDRVLVLAPHPDDESLGAAGLIQKAVAARAKVRVVFATDGDANQWAQRFAEHRIHIGASERERWGRRRQQEALRALAKLGVQPRDVVFLDFPDLGTTRLLMENDRKTLAAFRRAMGDWKPTIAAFPSRYDLHPDHNACFVFARVALGPPDAKRLTQLEYLVHKKPLADSRGAVVVNLAPSEVEKKRAAILSHASQMGLSRKSLVAFAQPQEKFYAPGPPRKTDANHPVRDASVRSGKLWLKIADEKTWNAFSRGSLLVLAGNERLRLPVSATEKHSAGNGARPDIPHPGFEITPPLQKFAGPVFVKLDSRGLFLDKAGWREVPAK